MKKFFVPSWGKKDAAIQFHSVGNSKISKIKTKKKAKVEEKNSNSIIEGRVSKVKKKVKNVQKEPNSQLQTEIQDSSKSLKTKLEETLIGGKFRFINEQLYTTDSAHAVAIFKDSTGLTSENFAAYHQGYRHQVSKWPINPLDKIIKMIKKLRKDFVIGDFGCGEGKLALSVPNKVISMDLVSSRDDIIACDMSCTSLAAESLDVAVFCLSLMGTNLNDYLLEANRVLKTNGLLYIAEVQSRFDDVKKFIKCLDACGFKLIKNDASNKLFFFFQFKKERIVGKVAIIEPLSLKPCLYRKR